MKLFSAGASPFGRKAKISFARIISAAEAEIIPTDTSQPDSENRKQKPLGKIPTLMSEGMAIYDSRVILDYLNDKAGGGKLFPASGKERVEILVGAALADGMMDGYPDCL